MKASTLTGAHPDGVLPRPKQVGRVAPRAPRWRTHAGLWLIASRARRARSDAPYLLRALDLEWRRASSLQPIRLQRMVSFGLKDSSVRQWTFSEDPFRLKFHAPARPH